MDSTLLRFVVFYGLRTVLQGISRCSKELEVPLETPKTAYYSLSRESSAGVSYYLKPVRHASAQMARSLIILESP